MTLRPSRDSQTEDARSFGSYTSVYSGRLVSKKTPARVEYYPGTLEERRRIIYPIVVYAKVRDPNDPTRPAFIVRYDNFYARDA